MCLKIVLFSFLLNCIALSNSARILAVVPTPSYTHQIAYRPLWRELSLRGHQLTLLTTEPMHDLSLKNLTEIDLHFSTKLWKEHVLDIINSNQKNVLKMISGAIYTINEIIDQQLQHPKVQALIKNESEHFDLLMVEFLLPAMYTFSERFKCPFIGVTTIEAPSACYEIIGNPSHPVLNPDFNLPFAGELTFVERVISTIFNVAIKLFAYYIFPLQHEIVKKHFGNDVPLLEDIARNVSMLFVNADPVFHSIRPLVPSVVQVGGGIHQPPNKPLPKDLLKHLDSAKQGFIYFSLGTNVNSKDLSEPTLTALLQTFAELPFLILWKFEAASLPAKPKNVIISKWFPQQDIFRHPNMRLFITQGGQHSMEEAVYNHIPMIGMPFFGDQQVNINRMVARGLGLLVDHKTLDKETFKKTVLEVINNEKYRNRVKELADLARDQPMTGLEKAVWWTEYVLRHKGAKHLRSPVLDIPFYQYYLLDVMGFCLLVVLVIIYLLITIVRLCKLVKYCIFKQKEKVQ